MRVSRHNGRAGAHGTYNPKHNDREFDVENTEDINSELTENNIYWNCYDRKLVRHGDLDDSFHSFADAEKSFYELVYGDYLYGQNNRHIASRHKERCRTMDEVRMNPKTCPEETIYQIGNVDKHVDYEVLATISAEFFQEINSRYGSHVHTLDWALHLDEGTPHIHERHVFDVVNKYGERQPKQEEALKELGFELPDPTKKSGKYNNRKMNYDAACRKLFIEICKKHGIEIEEEPIYGGKQYREKQEYIIEKLNARIEDLEKLLDEVSAIAYDKACDTIVEAIVDKTQAEDMKHINKYKQWILSDKCKAPKDVKIFAAKRFDGLNDVFAKIRSNIITTVKKMLSSPDKRAKITEQIKAEAKPSVREFIRKATAELEAARTLKPTTPRHKEVER